MGLLAHQRVPFQILAELVGDRVLEAVVGNRLSQIETLRSRERHDGNHLPQLVSERKQVATVEDVE